MNTRFNQHVCHVFVGQNEDSGVAVDGLMAMLAMLASSIFKIILFIAATELGMVIMLRGKRHAERYRGIMYKPLEFNMDTSMPQIAFMHLYFIGATFSRLSSMVFMLWFIGSSLV